MIQTLTIKNFAIIDSAEISFESGLNILSGETGAGKSIVLEAISLILGGRASTDLVRSGADHAKVEGLFSVENLPWLRERMEKLGLEPCQDELLIQRVIQENGKNKIYVNGQLSTLSILQQLCQGLVDLCSQHEHQSLLRSEVQLDLLDRYAGLEKHSAEISALWEKRAGILSRLEELNLAGGDAATRLDFLKFQREEIASTELSAGEDEALSEERRHLQTATHRIERAEKARLALEGTGSADEGSGALTLLRSALLSLRSLAETDPSAQNTLDELSEAVERIEDTALELNRYVGQAQANPDRLEWIRERLAQISSLKRKYGASIEEILASLGRIDQEIALLDNLDRSRADLENELREVEEKLLSLGTKLSKKRQAAAKLLSASISAELQELKMEGSELRVSVEFSGAVPDWTARGGDRIEFLIRTNVGEDLKPLQKTASGGELSRVMLAIRRMISDQGGVGVYLFDEIDAGIGGQTAFVVGKKLKSVSQENQVICITHLPQVASFADHHLCVQKRVQGQRTVTEVVELKKEAQLDEIARMLGGPTLTQKSRENAQELLRLAR